MATWRIPASRTSIFLCRVVQMWGRGRTLVIAVISFILLGVGAGFPLAAQETSQNDTGLGILLVEGVEGPSLSIVVEMRESLLASSMSASESVRLADAALKKAVALAKQAGATPGPTPTPLPPSIADEYVKAMTEALTAFEEAMVSIGNLNRATGPLVERMGQVAETVRDLSVPDPSTLSASVNASEIQAATSASTVLNDATFAMVDSLTDTEVTSAQILPGTQPVLLQLNDLVEAAKADVIGALPPSLDPALQDIQVALNVVDAHLDFADRQFYTVATGVDVLIESLLIPLPGGGSGCDRRGTETNVTFHYGDANGNVCTGTAGPDVFYTKGGADTAYGRGSHDSIHLGSGSDNGHGETGPDSVFGGIGNDSIWGGYGHDKIDDGKNYTNDFDEVYGGPGTDDGDIHDHDMRDIWRGGVGNDKDPAYDFDPLEEHPPVHDDVQL